MANDSLINPLELIREIAGRSIDSRMSGIHVNSTVWKGSNAISPFDNVDPVPGTSIVSSDSAAKWFIMGSGVWGGSSDIIAE